MIWSKVIYDLGCGAMETPFSETDNLRYGRGVPGWRPLKIFPQIDIIYNAADNYS